MIKRARTLFATLLLGAVPAAMAGIVGIPGLGAPTFSEAQIQAAFQQGQATGQRESAALCIGAPADCGCNEGLNPCGITPTSTLTGAQFGETEPNDHIVAADPLITQVIYWGQSRSIIDQDWFYLTTVEPNQLLTLVFTVPDRVLADTSRLSQGWLVQVRDAAGNIYAQFDTRFALDDLGTANKNESQEISYPVFLGHTGTYYVVVEPRLADPGGTPITDPLPPDTNLNDLSILFSPYNIAAFKQFSGLDAAPPDVNFHDVEVEPNNTNETANPIVSGVTLFGLLRQVNEGTVVGFIPPDDPVNGQPVFLQTDIDRFRYRAPGPEQIQFTMCGKEACTEDTFWFVEVTNAAGTPLISFNTDKSETVRFGVPAAGDYFIEIGFQRTTDAFCSLFSDIFECRQESTACQVLDITAVEEVPAVTEDLTTTPPILGSDREPGRVECTYASGNICESVGESATSVSCIRTDLTPVTDPTAPPLATSNPVWRWQTICEDFGPVCLFYGTIIDINALSVEYNFTLWGTRLNPLTYGTEAFEGSLERPSFFQAR